MRKVGRESLHGQGRVPGRSTRAAGSTSLGTRVILRLLCGLVVAAMLLGHAGLALASPGLCTAPMCRAAATSEVIRGGSFDAAATHGVSELFSIAEGQSWGHGVELSRVAARSAVAANTGADVVRYSPQAASRNLLGQVGDGFATTPGGRTVSAHAADRIVNGAAGRAPTTLARVDDILDSPTALRYDPLRDTVRVSQGKDFVVVRGSGAGQHIVTVMVP